MNKARMILSALAGCWLLVVAPSLPATEAAAKAAADERIDDLLQAAAQGDAVSVRRWLGDGVPADAGDRRRGFTPLHNAAAMGHATIVQILIDAGASVDASDRNGVTPLVSAAYHGHVQVLALLLDHGADPNHRPQAGPNPLAAALYAGSRPALDILLAAGADPSRADFAGRSAYDVAAGMKRPTLLAALPARMETPDE